MSDNVQGVEDGAINALPDLYSGKSQVQILAAKGATVLYLIKDLETNRASVTQ